jgi:hypothetical protein
MANGNSAHQSPFEQGRMVPYIKRYTLPLLPFERQLIETAGITEDEYRFFVAEAYKRSQIRPAEYDLIPDIQAVAPLLAAGYLAAAGGTAAKSAAITSAVISFAIGLALTAASYLLAPKPKMPGAQDPTRQRRLSNITGASRFAPTSGFDSLAELSSYADPVPVIFGRYTGATGGMLITPKMVWSRAFSYGTTQAIKQLYIIGEQGVGTTGIDRPDLTGIFLGSTPLDAAYAHLYAFYWRSGTFNGTSRIKSDNFRYGSRGTLDSGDPESNADVFVAPTRESLTDTAFCQAYTPSSNTQFGVYSPIYNGTDYRVNFRLHPAIETGSPDDDIKPVVLEQVKVTGDYALKGRTNDWENKVRNRGQQGTGRAYSRRMGVISLQRGSTTYTATGATKFIEMQAAINDTCVFRIDPTRLRKELYWSDRTENDGFRMKNVKIDDINSELDSQAISADSQLQLGETIQIGFTVWKVVNRTQALWMPRKNMTQDITLRCIDLLGSPGDNRKVGILNTYYLTTGVTSDPDLNEGATSIIPVSFYPLLRTQIGLVRNSRTCDCTEIGFKSRVFNYANGLCNFSNLPKPDEFERLQKKKVITQNGQMTQYFQRTSVFAVQVRPAELDANGNEYAWSLMGASFCISGDQPIDLYNFLRFEHPRSGGFETKQWEFRFVPRSSANTIRHMGVGDLFWQLDQRYLTDSNALLSRTVSTAYGDFKIYGVGKQRDVTELEFNLEMTQNGEITNSSVTYALPSAASIAYWTPENYQNDATIQRRLRQAFLWEQFGPYYKSGGGSYDLGQVATRTRTYTVGSKTISVTWSAQLITNNGSFLPVELFGRIWSDLGISVNPAGSTGSWTVNESFVAQQTASATNPVLTTGAVPNLSGLIFGPNVRIDSLQTVVIPAGLNADRIFEDKSQLADVSFYSDLLQKSNNDAPEHEIVYVNEIVDNPTTPQYTNMVMMGLALKASKTYAQLDQVRVWKDDGLPVTRFHPDEAGTVGASNLLCDLIYYLLTDPVAGAGTLISPAQIKTNDFAAVARFLRTNKLFFDGAIVDATNIRDFITSVAPFFLCNFVIRDGLFSLVPAIPTTPSGGISTDAVPISALFTSGNIIEDTFTIEYLNSEERNNIQAVMRYRQGAKNQLPVERTLNLRWNNTTSTSDRIESFDLTQYCTSKDHALLAAKYILSIRRRVTHSVRFKTTPQGLNLAPGSYIRVITESSPYSGVNNGVVSETGAITSATPLANGNYSVVYYRPPAETVSAGTLTVSNGATTQADLYGSVFSIVTGSTSSNTYVVEQLTLDAEGLVEIVASHFPTDASYRSVIAQDLVSTSNFIEEA